MRLDENVGSETPAIEIHSGRPTDACNGRQADHRYGGIIEDPMLESHQFQAEATPLGDLALEL